VSQSGDAGPPRPKGGIGYHRGGRATFTKENPSGAAPAGSNSDHGTPERSRGLWPWLFLVAVAAAIVALLVR